jgi:ABC-2 type transport system ATP-binding protein
MYLQVHAPGADVAAALRGVAGVTGVSSTPGADGLTTLEVASAQGRDVRRDLAAAVVGNGWGLLELRPMRMSLEDIFLSLTTEEAAGAEPAREEEVARA